MDNTNIACCNIANMVIMVYIHLQALTFTISYVEAIIFHDGREGHMNKSHAVDEKI